MKAVLARRAAKGNGEERLNKSFWFLEHIRHKYEIEEEVGKGYFAHTCKGRCRKGELKGLQVAIKIISESHVSVPNGIELSNIVYEFRKRAFQRENLDVLEKN
ncbi:CDPK-related kinase 5-like protein [Tanacetum coccineum]